jgi:hypothetical protein
MKNKYMLIYWWGYHKNSDNDNRPHIEWIDKEADQHFTEDNGFDIDDIENIKELSPGDDHEIWGAVSTTKLTIYCYA